MGDKRPQNVEKTKTEQLFFSNRCSVFFILPDYCLLGKAAPTLRQILYCFMHLIPILINVLERLFDELIKELALDRFVVVSGCFRRSDGKAVRIRKAHLRRRRRR